MLSLISQSKNTGATYHEAGPISNSKCKTFTTSISLNPQSAFESKDGEYKSTPSRCCLSEEPLKIGRCESEHQAEDKNDYMDRPLFHCCEPDAFYRCKADGKCYGDIVPSKSEDGGCSTVNGPSSSTVKSHRRSRSDICDLKTTLVSNVPIRTCDLPSMPVMLKSTIDSGVCGSELIAVFFHLLLSIYRQTLQL